MFHQLKVPISAEMYADFRVIMWITRSVGMFPLVVEKTKSGLFLKWSPWYALYSYLLGVTIIISTYYGQFEDFLVKNQIKSIRVISNTDKIVLFLAVNGYCFRIFYGVFVMPTKMLITFFEYMRCINEVDSIIHTTYTKSGRYKSVLLLTLPFSYMIMVSTLDNYMSYVLAGDKIGLLGVIKRNTGIASAATLSVVLEYMNRHMAYSLEKRLEQLNNLLIKENQKIQNEVTKEHRRNLVFVGAKPITMTQFSKSSGFDHQDEAILDLRRAYLKLMDAVSILNQFLGVNMLIGTISVLFLLIVSPYFLILALEGKRRGIIELIPRIGLFFTHVIKALLITEPWYACLVQAELMKGSICKLSSLKIDRRLSKQVNSFTMVLCLRPYCVSACGFFTIDRLLFTSLIEAITTFLVILLQAQENDGK